MNWKYISAEPPPQQDGEDLLFWNGYSARIGAWDNSHQCFFTDGEGFRMDLSNYTHWAHIDPPEE